MKYPIYLSLIVFLAAITSSCKKKEKEIIEEENPPTVTYDSYSALRKGNYWIYGRFRIEADGSESRLKETDSSYIEKDTVIHSNIYFKLRSHDFVLNRDFTSYLRDSLSYIINSSGAIVFAPKDFSTIFYTIDIQLPPDTLYKLTRKMANKDLVINTPAGTFTTSAMEDTYQVYPKHALPGVSNTRRMYSRYAKDIGLVLQTEYFYLVQTWETERRLLRYHLN